ALPSATANVMGLPQFSEPGCTRPPSRNLWPGAICCSAAIDGVEKNLIEEENPYNTSPVAKPSTASALPIIVSRRCLRVMQTLSSRACSRSSVKSEILQTIVEKPQPLGIARDGLSGVTARNLCLFLIAHHQIGPHKAQPAIDVVAVLFQPGGQAIHHAPYHGGAVALAHLLCGRDCTLRES